MQRAIQCATRACWRAGRRSACIKFGIWRAEEEDEGEGEGEWLLYDSHDLKKISGAAFAVNVGNFEGERRRCSTNKSPHPGVDLSVERRALSPPFDCWDPTGIPFGSACLLHSFLSLLNSSRAGCGALADFASRAAALRHTVYSDSSTPARNPDFCCRHLHASPPSPR
jgi:hypothetical protein